MLPPLAPLTELEKRVDVDDTDLANSALADASALARHAARPVTWTDENGALTQVPDVVVTIVLRAAKRFLVNPDGYASEQVSQYSYRYGGNSSRGEVFLTDDEKREVREAAKIPLLKSIAFTIPELNTHACRNPAECLCCLRDLMEESA
ncbi:hypothetical protein ACFQS3_02630 [Glycomyces mayteni]|uniref:Uncharacterized protein n=1 Tax=Glycomyces mayteni TaxID=543887 RepID=A0ABW2D5Z4_9ACTN|nr:hypothetical protein GCM10025732_48270 [Glycomyces mayteni]